MTNNYRTLENIARDILAGKSEPPKVSYRSLINTARDILQGEQTTNEAETTSPPIGTLEVGRPSPTTSEPEAENPDEAKKKKKDANADDPKAITIGQGNPIDFEPTTDVPQDDLDNKKDKKVTEDTKKSLGTGIHFGNYQRSIRKRVTNILKTNQNIADKHEIRPRGGEEIKEHRYSKWEQRQMDIAYSKHMDGLERDRNRKCPDCGGTGETEVPTSRNINDPNFQKQKCPTCNGSGLNEMTKAEEDRIAMYHRAGNAEATKKKKKGNKFERIHQIITGDKGLRRRHTNEETITEAGEFDPFAATGQILGNLLHVLTHSRHGRRVRNMRQKPASSSDNVPESDTPPVKAPESAEKAKEAPRQKPNQKTYKVYSQKGKEWAEVKGQQFRSKSEARQFIKAAHGAKGGGSGVEFRIGESDMQRRAILEGAMKRWLMDMQYHAEECLHGSKGDRKAAKVSFLKKYPNQGHVFDNHMQELDQYNSGADQREENVNEYFSLAPAAGGFTAAFTAAQKAKACGSGPGIITQAAINHPYIAAGIGATVAAGALTKYLMNRQKNKEADQEHRMQRVMRLFDKRSEKWHHNEEAINEISKGKALNYISKAIDDVGREAGDLGFEIAQGKYPKSERIIRGGTRRANISLAARKLANKSVRVPATEETVNEHQRRIGMRGDKKDALIAREMAKGHPVGKGLMQYAAEVEKELAKKREDKAEWIRYFHGVQEENKDQARNLLNRIRLTIHEARHSKGGGIKRAGLTHMDAGDQHIINQLRTAVDIGTHDVNFLDKSIVKMDRSAAQKALEVYSGLRTSIDKEKAMKRMWASPQSMNDFLAGKPEVEKPTGPSMPFGFRPKGIKDRPEASRKPQKRDSIVAQPISPQEVIDKPGTENMSYRPGEKKPKFWT